MLQACLSTALDMWGVAANVAVISEDIFKTKIKSLDIPESVKIFVTFKERNKKSFSILL